MKYLEKRMVYPQVTWKEQRHILTCDPMTFVKDLDVVLILPWNSKTQHLIVITCILIYIVSWNGMVYKEKTCQEQIHLLTCNPMTFVKHLDRYLGLPRNSLTQHLIDNSWTFIHVIPWKLMVYQEETYKEKTHHLKCDPITSVKHLNGA